MTGPTAPDRGTLTTMLAAWVAEAFEAPDVPLDDSTILMYVEGADSVRFLRLLGRLEEHFDLDLLEDEGPLPETFGELVDALQAILTAAQAQATPR